MPVRRSQGPGGLRAWTGSFDPKAPAWGAWFAV